MWSVFPVTNISLPVLVQKYDRPAIRFPLKGSCLPWNPDMNAQSNVCGEDRFVPDTVTLRTCCWIDDCVLKIKDWNQWELLMVTASIPPQVYYSIFLCFLNTILIVAIAKDDSTWPADKDGDQRTLNCLLFSTAAKIGVLCFLSCHNQRGQDLLLSWARRSNCGIAIHPLGILTGKQDTIQ